MNAAEARLEVGRARGGLAETLLALERLATAVEGDDLLRVGLDRAAADTRAADRRLAVVAQHLRASSPPAA